MVGGTDDSSFCPGLNPRSQCLLLLPTHPRPTLSKTFTNDATQKLYKVRAP